VGALNEVLDILKKFGLNLTHIESRASLSTNSYDFLISFEKADDRRIEVCFYSAIWIAHMPALHRSPYRHSSQSYKAFAHQLSSGLGPHPSLVLLFLSSSHETGSR
jgi:hypothetical protein